MAASGNGGPGHRRVGVIENDNALAVAASDDQVRAWCIQNLTVGHLHASGGAAPRLAWLVDDKPCGEGIERGAAAQGDAVKACPRWIVDDDARGTAKGVIRVEGLHIDDGTGSRIDSHLHVSDPGVVDREMGSAQVDARVPQRTA